MMECYVFVFELSANICICLEVIASQTFYSQPLFQF